MNEPNKENPKTSKRSKRKPAMEPLGWDEIVSQPGMGGYLSFLNGPVFLPHLQGAAAAPEIDPGAVSIPESVSSPEVVKNAVHQTLPEADKDPGVLLVPQVSNESIPEAASAPGAVLSTSSDSIPQPDPGPATESTPGSKAYSLVDAGRTNSAPEVVSIPAFPPGPRLRIRRCAATHDGHSLGEEVLYQSLWKAAATESAETRTITIGWRGMSQLCRMTPKNCKINTQRLMRKLALEILSPYNTPESIGTTYRVYSDDAILKRRREAGFEWVVRSRGVDFVNPATGLSILPICAPTH
jgi:hypothetical protein